MTSAAAYRAIAQAYPQARVVLDPIAHPRDSVTLEMALFLTKQARAATEPTTAQETVALLDGAQALTVIVHEGRVVPVTR